jgi:CDP-diacylglycerol--glycerol-3-phosphate 3-phosphatidyltransferase
MANLFSYSRIFLAILFTYLIYQSQAVPAFLVLSLAATTDYLDGYFARKLNQVSDFGTMLDPVADRILIISVCLALLIKFWQPSFKLAAIVLICREVLVSLGYFWLKNKGVVIRVSRLGKVSTAFVFISFVITFILPKQGIYLLLAAIGLYFISTLAYVFEARRKIV